MYQVTANTFGEHYFTELFSGKNVAIADEPETTGGKNKGFSPGEYLAAALASCTSITLRMYADKKGWNLEKVEVDVTLERDETTNVTRFKRNITLHGNLDDSQRARLSVIADKCPVHKYLFNPIVIETQGI